MIAPFWKTLRIHYRNP